MEHSELPTVATRIRTFAIHTALLWSSKEFLLVMIMHGWYDQWLRNIMAFGTPVGRYLGHLGQRFHRELVSHRSLKCQCYEAAHCHSVGVRIFRSGGGNSLM